MIESEAAPSKGKSELALQNTDKTRAIGYVWLCSSCCRDMTVYVEGKDKVRVVRKRDGERTRVGNS